LNDLEKENLIAKINKIATEASDLLDANQDKLTTKTYKFLDEGIINLFAAKHSLKTQEQQQ